MLPIPCSLGFTTDRYNSKAGTHNHAYNVTSNGHQDTNHGLSSPLYSKNSAIQTPRERQNAKSVIQHEENLHHDL